MKIFFSQIIKYCFRPFRSRYAFYAITSLLLITLFITSVFFYVQLQKEQIRRDLDVAMSKVERTFVDIIDNTEYIMNLINFQIQEKPQDKEYINSILKKFRTNSRLSNQLSWTTFSWVDNNDILTVDATYGVMENPIDMSDRDYLSLTKIKLEKLILGRPVIGRPSNKWIISGGVGITNERKNYIGSMVIGFDLKILLFKLRNVMENPNIQDLVLFDDKLNIVTINDCIKYQDYDFSVNDRNLKKNLIELINDNKKQQITVTSLWDTSYTAHKIANTLYTILLITKHF